MFMRSLAANLFRPPEQAELWFQGIERKPIITSGFFAS